MVTNSAKGGLPEVLPFVLIYGKDNAFYPKKQEEIEMIEIVGTALNQWDTGRVVHITGVEAEYAHFANKGDSRAVVMEIVDNEAKIPDYLLQTGKPLCVYAVKDFVTLETRFFSVRNRERPENYVYEDDQRNYIYELISKAEDAADRANDAAERANDAADRIPEVFVKSVNDTYPDENGNISVSGLDGEDGISVTHKWDGTVLEVTSASGTSSADLKGPKGDAGKSVTITHIAESDGDGAINMVAFSDGKTLTIKNGSKGSPGDPGTDGYTPVKGTDYWTAADKTEMVNDVLAALPKWTGGSY